MANRIILSIGLNVGSSEPAAQLHNTLEYVAWLNGQRGNPGSVSYALGQSEWEGVPERFIQTELTVEPAPNSLAALPRLLAQDSIAVLYPGRDRWELINRDGTHSDGGTVADYPVIVAR